MLRPHLERMLLSARGGHFYRHLLHSLITKATPEEVEALYRTIQHIEEDAKQDGEHKVQRRYGLPR